MVYSDIILTARHCGVSKRQDQLSILLYFFAKMGLRVLALPAASGRFIPGLYTKSRVTVDIESTEITVRLRRPSYIHYMYGRGESFLTSIGVLLLLSLFQIAFLSQGSVFGLPTRHQMKLLF